jgi:hypothetical protein
MAAWAAGTASHSSIEYLRDGADAVNTGGDIGELEVGGLGKVAIEDDVVVVDDGTNDGSHGNAAVLALDGTTTLEGLGLSLEPAEGIVDAEGLGDTELELRDGEVGGDTAGLGGGEGGGRGGAKGGNSELHLDVYVIIRGVRSGHGGRGRQRNEDGGSAKNHALSSACFQVLLGGDWIGNLQFNLGHTTRSMHTKCRKKTQQNPPGMGK